MTLVSHILEDARRRLAIVNRNASMVEVAAILADPKTPLAVVCDEAGVAIGVLSRMDVVKLFARATDASSTTNAGSAMTQSFLACNEDQSLQLAWDALSGRGLRCAPVLDGSGRPVGVVHARDLVRALLDEVTHEELLLRDYVLGVGYR